MALLSNNQVGKVCCSLPQRIPVLAACCIPLPGKVFLVFLLLLIANTGLYMEARPSTQKRKSKALIFN